MKFKSIAAILPAYMFALLGLWACVGQYVGITYLLYDEWRLIGSIVLVISSLIYVALFYVNAHSVRIPRAAGIYSIILLILIFLRIAGAGDKVRAGLDAGVYGLLLFNIYALRTVSETRLTAVRNSVFLLFSLCLVPSSLQMLAALISAPPGEPLPMWQSSFANYRYYDDLVLACLFFVWSVRFNCSLKGGRFFLLLLSILGVLGLIIDSARAVLLGVSGGFMFAAISAPPGRRGELYFPAATFFSAVIAYFLLKSPGGESLARSTSSGRIELMSLALRYIVDRPLLGIGGMQWGVYSSGSEIYRDIVRIGIHHPHNLFVQWIVEWGVIGWMASGLIIYSLFATWRYRSQTNLLAIAAVVAIIVNISLSGAHVYPHTQLAYTCLLGFMLPATDPAKVLRKKEIFVLLSALLALVICFLASNVVAVLDVAGNEFDGSINRAPRYWEAGETTAFKWRVSLSDH